VPQEAHILKSLRQSKLFCFADADRFVLYTEFFTMAQQVSGRSRGWVWGLVVVAACLGLFFFLRISRAVVTVRTAQADRQDIVGTVSTTGKVELIQDFQAHAPTPGEVAKLFVHLGDKVRPGQELVKMDDSDARRGVAAAEATLQSAEALLAAMEQGGSQEELNTGKSDMASAKLQQEQAAATLSSLQKLQAQGAASASEVASARQRLADAQVHVDQLQTRRTGRYSASDLATQRAVVAQAKAALAAARSVYAGVDIRAPFAGTVYAIPVAEYDFVQAGESLLDVADLTKLQVIGYFDEPDVGKLAAGQPVTIGWDAKPSRVWHGHILQAPTTIISYGTRNVGECLISVDDAQGDLLPNTNVSAKVTTQKRTDVLSLPREALHTDGASNFVYKVVEGRLVKTPVEVGIGVNLTRFEVAAGINPGDTVALGATTDTDLKDGLRVKAQP
jgi:HlyD family secretion protein